MNKIRKSLEKKPKLAQVNIKHSQLYYISYPPKNSNIGHQKGMCPVDGVCTLDPENMDHIHLVNTQKTGIQSQLESERRKKNNEDYRSENSELDVHQYLNEIYFNDIHNKIYSV